MRRIRNLVVHALRELCPPALPIAVALAACLASRGAEAQTSTFNQFTLQYQNLKLGDVNQPDGGLRPLYPGGQYANTYMYINGQIAGTYYNYYSDPTNQTFDAGSTVGEIDLSGAALAADGGPIDYGAYVNIAYGGAGAFGPTRNFVFSQSHALTVSAGEQTAQFQPAFDPVRLCSIRVHLHQACDLPSVYSTSNNSAYTYGMSEDTTYESSLDPSLWDPRWANGFLLTHCTLNGDGLCTAASVPCTGDATCTCTGSDSCTITGEFLSLPDSPTPGPGTSTVTIYDVELSFLSHQTWSSQNNGQAISVPVTFDQDGNCAAADVDVAIPAEQCIPFPTAVAIGGEVWLSPPDSGCAFSDGDNLIFSGDLGCPTINGPASTYGYSGAIYNSPTGESVYASQYVGGSLIDGVLDTTFYGSQPSDTWPNLSVPSTDSIDYNKDTFVWTLVDGGVLDYTAEAYAGLSFPSFSFSIGDGDGRGGVIQLSAVQATDGGWWPAAVADDPSDAGSQYVGVFPNGMVAVRGDNPDANNVYNFSGQTGVFNGKVSLSGCVGMANLVNGWYASSLAEQTSGEFVVPAYYTTFPQFPNGSNYNSYTTTGYVDVLEGGTSGAIVTGNSLSRFLTTFDPQLNGYYQGYALAGSYNDGLMYLSFFRDADAGSGYLSEGFGYAISDPTGYQISPGQQTRYDMPAIEFGQINLVLNAFDNTGRPLAFSNPYVYISPLTGSGSGLSYANSAGVYGVSETQAVVHVVAPSGTALSTYITATIAGVNTAFPSIHVTAPDAGVAGACQAICVDPSDPGTTYLDDNTPPAVTFPDPIALAALHVGATSTLSGCACDSIPLGAVQLSSDAGVSAAVVVTDGGSCGCTGGQITSQFAFAPYTIGCGTNAFTITAPNRCGEAPPPAAYSFVGADQAPALADSSATLNVDQPGTVTLHGTDPDSDPLAYSIISATRQDNGASTATAYSLPGDAAISSGVFSWMPTGAEFSPAQLPSKVVVTVQVSDGCLTAQAQLSLTVAAVAVVLSPPAMAVYSGTNLLSQPNRIAMSEQGSITLRLQGSDADSADTYSYGCSNLPTFATLNLSGTIQLHPPVGAHAAASYRFHCWLTDAHGQHDDDGTDGAGADVCGSQDDQSGKCGQDISVLVSNAYTPPTLTVYSGSTLLTQPNQVAVAEGGTLSLLLVGADSVAGDSFAYACANLPAGLTATSTGSISWVPPVGSHSPSPYVVHCWLTDADGQHDDDGASGGVCGAVDDQSGRCGQDISIVVSDEFARPTMAVLAGGVALTQPNRVYVEEQGTVSLQLVGQDTVGGDSFSYACANQPSGLTLSSTGAIGWTPSAGVHANSPYLVHCWLTDADGQHDDDGASGGVCGAQDDHSGTCGQDIAIYVAQPLAFDPIGDQVVSAGTKLQFTAHADDADGGTVHYSDPGAPDASTLDANTGLFTWTPALSDVTLLDAGAHPIGVTFVAANGTETVSQTVHILVTEPPDLGITIQPIPAVTVPVGTVVMFTVAAADASGFTVTCTAASLPSGATFVNDQFDWVPETVGSFAVAVTCSDTQGKSATATATIDVVSATVDAGADAGTGSLKPATGCGCHQSSPQPAFITLLGALALAWRRRRSRLGRANRKAFTA